jgi:UDP-glucose 4-epimerase
VASRGSPFSKRLLADVAPTINGDGRYIRDYVYGPDVARANLLALSASAERLPAGRLTSLNIGTGIGTDVNELELAIRESMAVVLGRKGRQSASPPAHHGPARPGDLRSNLIDARLAAEILGWRPEVGLDEGLERTVAWFAAASVS